MKTRQPATDTEVADLAAATSAFEASLPATVGVSGDWPELTAVRREQLHEIRRLIQVVDMSRWPRAGCPGCLGHGLYFVDPEDHPDWRPCRQCLTTGLQIELSSGGKS